MEHEKRLPVNSAAHREHEVRHADAHDEQETTADDELTSAQLAERLGIHLNTLYGYEKELGIKPRIGSKRRKYFDSEAVAILEAVKDLRDQDLGFATIRRRLNVSVLREHDAEEALQGEHAVEGGSALEGVRGEHDVEPSAPREHGVELSGVVAMLDKLNTEKDALHRELREKEALLAVFQERNTVLAEKVKLLEAPKPEPVEEAPRRAWWRIF